MQGDYFRWNNVEVALESQNASRISSRDEWTVVGNWKWDSSIVSRGDVIQNRKFPDETYSSCLGS